MNIKALAVALLALSGCSINTKVNPVPEPAKISSLCILHNPEVLMDEFEPAVQRIMEAQGVDTLVVEPPTPKECHYRMEYSANWRWDLAMYLWFAEFRIYDGADKIAEAQYDARWGGARLDKFGTTASKIEPVLQGLLGRKQQVAR
jgi:hypothetical protein